MILRWLHHWWHARYGYPRRTLRRNPYVVAGTSLTAPSCCVCQLAGLYCPIWHLHVCITSLWLLQGQWQFFGCLQVSFQHVCFGVLLQGVDYARRAANRRAMWGDYDDDDQPEQWEG